MTPSSAESPRSSIIDSTSITKRTKRGLTSPAKPSPTKDKAFPLSTPKPNWPQPSNPRSPKKSSMKWRRKPASKSSKVVLISKRARPRKAHASLPCILKMDGLSPPAFSLMPPTKETFWPKQVFPLSPDANPMPPTTKPGMATPAPAGRTSFEMESTPT